MTWQPLLLSFEVALWSTLLAGLAGTALGALLARRGLPGRDLIDVLVTSPLLLPPTVLGYYVLVALGRRSPLGQLYEQVTGEPIVFTFAGAVVAATLGSLPLVVKSARAAFESVDVRLLQAARTLGASPLRAFLTIGLPLARAGVAAGLMLGFARSLGDFGVTLMVAGNIPGVTQTAALAIYDALQAGRDQQAAGMISVLSAVALSALYLANRLTRRHE